MKSPIKPGSALLTSAAALVEEMRRHEAAVASFRESTSIPKILFSVRVKYYRPAVSVRKASRGSLPGIARLGAAARSITEPIADYRLFEERIATTADAFSWLEDVSLCIDSLIGEAETIGIAAENTTWIDIASESATLTRQLQAARNNILLMQRAVSARHLS
jgi:hypothetical protein